MTKDLVFKKLLIIDASYLLHRNMNVQGLWDLKSSKGVRTGGIMGFFRSLNSIMDYEHYPVLCWDSKVSPRRLEIYPDYKKNLKWKEASLVERSARQILDESVDTQLSDVEVPEEFSGDEDDYLQKVREKVNEVMSNRTQYGTDNDPDDYLTQYRYQRSKIIEICESLGIPSVRIYEWEGDDLITLLTRITQQSIVITDDWDMAQLLTPGRVDVHRVLNKEYLTHDEFLSREGLLSIREFVIAKAIRGDGSDNIDGIKGCGPKRASEIARVIFTCNEDPDEYLPRLEEEYGRYKYMQNFLADHDKFLRNMQLMDLSLVPHDLEVIDKIIVEVKRSLGKPDMLKSLSKLGELEITSFDINSAISKINVASMNCMID